MEIRNNTPSFGMAYKAPSPEDMTKFVDHLLDSGMSAKEAKRALINLQKTHAGDAHFNWKSVIAADGSLEAEVTPISEKAKEMCDSGKIIFSPSKASAAFYDRAAKCEERCAARLEGSKGIKLILANIRNFFDRKLLALDRLTDPTTALPGQIRVASSQVKRAEASVTSRLADEATIKSAFNVVVDDATPVAKLTDKV